MVLWSWGANSHGQLNQGVVTEQTDIPTVVPFSSKIKQIACGGGHTIIIDEEGKIYSCGWNHKLQLGNDKPEHYTFERIWNLSGIYFTKIACGWDFTFGLTNDQFLFVWGSNTHGQLGLPKKHFSESVKPVRLQIKAKEISAGLRHSAIINFKGEVWITGCGKHGQLGLGIDILSKDTFTKIPNMSEVTHIACGQNHTVAWDSNQYSLYVWGDNRHSQLLLNPKKYPKVWSPQKIDIGVKNTVKKILSGWTNIALWLENGDLLTWGRNNYGQLGSSSLSSNNTAHIKLPGTRQIIDVAMGSEHTICIADDNTLWAWGWNEHSNTGTGNDECVFEPTQVHFKNYIGKISAIFSGSGHNFLITEVDDNYINHYCKKVTIK